MKDSEKTREQLIGELAELRQQLEKMAAERGHKKADQKFKQLEEMFYKAFQCSPEAIAIVSAKEEKYIDVNDNYIKMFGYSREELIGKKAFLNNWVTLEDHAKMLKMIEEHGRFYNEEFGFRTKSGEIRTRLLTLEPITIKGEACRIGFSIDITERKRTEELMKKAVGELESFVYMIPDMAWLKDVNSNFILANKSFCDALGKDLKYLKNHSPEVCFGAEKAREFIKDDLKVMTNRKKIIFEEEFIDEHQNKRWVETVKSPIIDASGKVTGTIGISRDISERKMMEQALRESEEKFSKAFHASPEAIAIVTETDERYVDVNESYTRMTGYSREELIGKTIYSINIWATPEGHTKMRQILQEKGRIYNEEFDYRTKSGKIRTRLFSLEPITIKEEPCTIGASIDITDYKRMEAKAREVETLKQVDKLRSELLANVSHEFRTPLASIKGFATMLLDYYKRLTAAEKREYLETIDKNADQLVELIEQLLEMSRLGAGMLAIKKAPANIVILCKSAINEAQKREPGYTFSLDIPPKLPKTNIDSRRIREVLDHIIYNAVKYSNSGTEIELSVQKNDRDILFTVTDQGAGIPKSDLPRVFERMFHSTRGQKKGVPGAGLGLPICKGLIEAHGGKIWLESEEGVGTRCFFTLPLNNSNRSNDTDKSNQREESARS